MNRSKFTITHKDEEMFELVKRTDHKTLAKWAIECVERVIHFFEEKHPLDSRPRKAIDTLQVWIDTGVFKMVDIRGASLASHAAAREVGEDNSARSAARAAGQAAATAHVPTHAIGAASYSQQAIFRATRESEEDIEVAKEKDWQYKRLVELNQKS